MQPRTILTEFDTHAQSSHLAAKFELFEGPVHTNEHNSGNIVNLPKGQSKMENIHSSDEDEGGDGTGSPSPAQFDFGLQKAVNKIHISRAHKKLQALQPIIQPIIGSKGSRMENKVINQRESLMRVLSRTQVKVKPKRMSLVEHTDSNYITAEPATLYNQMSNISRSTNVSAIRPKQLRMASSNHSK